MYRDVVSRIRDCGGRERCSRRGAKFVLRLEPLEDRVVPTGVGTWSAFTPVGGSPRWGAPIVTLGPLSQGGTFVTAATAYYFGGTDGTTTFGDTEAFREDVLLQVPVNPGSSPPARHDHAAVAFNNKMYIFGGEDANGHSLNDVWAFDPLEDTWQQQPSQSGPSAWPGGFDAVAVTIGQQIILYGGTINNGGGNQATTANAYAYNPINGSWTKLAADPLGSDPAATAGVFNGKMYVFSSTSNTIEVFDPVQNSWSAVNPQGTSPAPRALAAGTSLSSVFWLVGGTGSSGDTWLYNFTTNSWVQKASFPGGPGSSDMGAAAFYNFGIPLLVTYGGEVPDTTTHQPVPLQSFDDFSVGRLLSIDFVNAVDNFPAGFPNLVVPHLVVAEPGGTSTYTVTLGSNPFAGTATIPLSSTNPAEGTVSPSQLVFTSTNANTPQTITVTGGSDAMKDGDVLFQIQYGPIVSSDPDLSGLTDFVPVIARDVPTFTVGTSSTYSITAHGYTVTPPGNLPSWLTFDSTTNSISGIPPVGSAGTYPLTFQGVDSNTKLSLNVVVANAPTLSAIAPNAVTAGSPNTTVTVTGANFVNQSTVEFNGAPLVTTFVSNQRLTAVIPAADLANTGRAAITVVNPGPGGGTSGSASLTINPPYQAPAVTRDPQDQSANAGQSASFDAAASGTPPPSVQWQVSTDNGSTFTDIPGATSTTLTVPATAADTGDKYRAVFNNGVGQATSKAATLAVKSFAPVITSQPVSLHVPAGSQASFSVTVTADPPATVQWQRAKKGKNKFTNIAGATAPTLRLTATTATSGEKFQAVITNKFDTLDSAIVTLTVAKAKRKK
jgi:hypothetical protein